MLVPEADLGRDGLVLVDARLDLDGPEAQAVAREPIDEQLAVVRPVAPAGHPAHHVALAGGREGEHQEVLRLLLARQGHDDVVTVHGLCHVAVDLGRALPQVLLVVEDLRVGHVIRLVLGRLDVEQVDRVPHVGPERLGHLREVAEQRREDGPGHQDQGVAHVGHVERGRAVVRVDGDLDGIADVVDGLGDRRPVGREDRRVRKQVRRRVGVEDPDDAALVDDGIHVAVVGEERRQAPDHAADVAAPEDARLVREAARQKDVPVAEVIGKEEPPQQGVHRDARLAGVMGGAGARLGRIVELVLPGLDEDVVVGQFAEVDARAGEVDRHRRLRRDVLDPHLREALAGDGVDGAHAQAVPVGVGEVEVDPRAALRGQELGIEFPRRHVDLAVAAVHLVAVDRHAREPVVRPQALQLLIGRPQDAPVPEADVVEGARLALEVLQGEVAGGGELADLDLVQAVGVLRRADVVAEVLLLQVEFVRDDVEPLHAHRCEAHEDDVQARDQQESRDGHLGPHAQAAPQREHGRQDADGHHHVVGQQADLVVDVADAEDDAPGRVRQGEAVEPVTERQPREEDCPEKGKVDRGRPRDPGEGHSDAAAEEVGRAGPQQAQRRQGQDEVLQRLQHRQREDVEPRVVAEDRVGPVEVGGVQELLEQEPPVGVVMGEPERQEENRRRRHHPQQPLNRQRRDLDRQAAHREPPAGRQFPRRIRVDREPQGRHQEHDCADHDARHQFRHEHVLVAHRAEPQVVGIERRDLAEDPQGSPDDRDCQEDPRPQLHPAKQHPYLDPPRPS